ncbi:pseudouridine synthase [Saliterribacillus persicus]|uniref:Pseudouridine synthase n=1 Tax=Saliterribacillus persicus TaxID=930114 RepID=A0A368XA77_9BACI|nr:pseudouridine synthase [Saliterribacillus persicus]RCW64871.1 ribosomal large subunit pseudouridine synthase B [Saliterribacillus persicus]
MEQKLERLQKVIAQSGVTSRRKAEKLIEDGKVKVNGKTIRELGTKVSKTDEVAVNGIPLEKEHTVAFLFYKPRGVISSVKDDKDRKIVLDFFPEVQERIFPVGRLDYDSSGLLLMTNDGELANLLMHPKHAISKTYVIKTKGIPSPQTLNRCKKGVKVGKDILKADQLKILSTDRQKDAAIIEIVLHQGKNRHIRRMFEALEFPVQKLKREKYGPLTLENLKPGDHRELLLKEINQLKSFATKL